MMSRNMPRETAEEKQRNDELRKLHCVLCTLSGDFRTRPIEIHHIVRGNKRLGHWYTLQLCVGHHQGQWTDQVIRVGIKSGRHAFKAAYGYDELALWQRLQVALMLDDSLPPTKILPRRVCVQDQTLVESAANQISDSASPIGQTPDLRGGAEVGRGQRVAATEGKS
jgi:hypothetical protein